jgi:hypothetical protein
MRISLRILNLVFRERKLKNNEFLQIGTLLLKSKGDFNMLFIKSIESLNSREFWSRITKGLRKKTKLQIRKRKNNKLQKKLRITLHKLYKNYAKINKNIKGKNEYKVNKITRLKLQKLLLIKNIINKTKTKFLIKNLVQKKKKKKNKIKKKFYNILQNIKVKRKNKINFNNVKFSDVFSKHPQEFVRNTKSSVRHIINRLKKKKTFKGLIKGAKTFPIKRKVKNSYFKKLFINIKRKLKFVLKRIIKFSTQTTINKKFSIKFLIKNFMASLHFLKSKKVIKNFKKIPYYLNHRKLVYLLKSDKQHNLKKNKLFKTSFKKHANSFSIIRIKKSYSQIHGFYF